MTILVCGLLLLLGSHSVVALAPGPRDRLRTRLGKRGWAWAVSVISTVALVLVVLGVRQMRAAPVVLYVPGVAAHWLARGLMLGVFPILLGAWFPGRLARAVRQPLAAAIALWAIAHLCANGMLHDALLFGSFLAWSALDALSLARRGGPGLRTAPPADSNDAFVVVAGLVLYVIVAFVLHPTLFGVAPFGDWPFRRGP